MFLICFYFCLFYMEVSEGFAWLGMRHHDVLSSLSKNMVNWGNCPNMKTTTISILLFLTSFCGLVMFHCGVCGLCGLSRFLKHLLQTS